MEEQNLEIKEEKKDSSAGQKQIAGAILLAGLIIAGSILIRGNRPSVTNQPENGENDRIEGIVDLDPVSLKDRVIGNAGARVTIVEYADFQCPFCGMFFKEAGQKIMNDYVNTGKVKFVYRDYAFLGEESVRAAEAARCAGDQGKFWEYHDYLFTHQSGENRGQFSDQNLKVFAKDLQLNITSFGNCLDSEKYKDEVDLERESGTKAGVQGTPKGFILKNGKVVDTIDGAESSVAVSAKIDKALK